MNKITAKIGKIIIVLVAFLVFSNAEALAYSVETYYDNWRLKTKEVNPEEDENSEFYLKRARYYYYNEVAYTDPQTGGEYGRIYRMDIYGDLIDPPSLNFDGIDDYVSIADNDSLDIGTPGQLLQQDSIGEMAAISRCPKRIAADLQNLLTIR